MNPAAASMVITWRGRSVVACRMHYRLFATCAPADDLGWLVGWTRTSGAYRPDRIGD
jgi:hypothetical protein